MGSHTPPEDRSPGHSCTLARKTEPPRSSWTPGLRGLWEQDSWDIQPLGILLLPPISSPIT